jgi:SNF2 family DNA or RNA helicase
MEFRARYFRDKNAGMDRQKYFPNWVPIAGSMEEISKRMDKSSMRVLKKDCLDLPPLVRKVVTIEMNGEQRKAYKEMLNEFITFFESQGEQHTAMATLAITKGLRLMQLASGYVRTVDGQEVPLAEGFSPKQEALKELLEDLICGNQKNKVLIWAVWRQNYSQIRAVLDKLKIKFVEVHGDVDDKKKFANVDAFTSDPEVRVLLGHPASAGCGINLIAASYCIFFSRNFSLENDIQAEARNYRGGSEIHEKVTRIDLVTKDSIEEEIVNALSRKEAIGVEVLKQITVKAERS